MIPWADQCAQALASRAEGFVPPLGRHHCCCPPRPPRQLLHQLLRQLEADSNLYLQLNHLQHLRQYLQHQHQVRAQ